VFELGECLLPFSSECFVFPFAKSKYKDEVHRTMIFNLLFYVVVREEHILRVLDNRELRMRLGPN
jgi:hypothetical protein